MRKSLLMLMLVLAPVFTAAAGPLVLDASFEGVISPFYPYYQTGPGFSSPSWTFTGGSGVDPSSNTWFVSPAPDGSKAAFLQNVSAFSQTISGFTIGDIYQVTYFAAQRPGYAANAIKLLLDGTDLGTYTPSTTDFLQVVSGTMAATSSSLTLEFQGTLIDGDFDSAVDMVSVQDVTPRGATPEPSTLVLGLLSFTTLAVLRRRRTI